MVHHIVVHLEVRQSGMEAADRIAAVVEQLRTAAVLAEHRTAAEEEVRRTGLVVADPVTICVSA